MPDEAQRRKERSRFPEGTSGDTAVSAALAMFGRYVFPWRLVLGVVAVGAGAWLIRPGRLFGAWHGAGMLFCLGLVLAGLALRAWAGATAGLHTRSGTIEAPRLVTGGPYAHVRNPIYLGTVLLGLGMTGLLGDPRLIPLCVAVFLFLYLSIIPAEEAFLRKTFGPEYAAFCAGVPRLLPRLSRWSGSHPLPLKWRGAVGDGFIGLFLVAIYFGLKAVAAFRG